MSGRLERLTPLVSRARLGVAVLVAAGVFGAVAVQGAAADTPPLESLSTTSLPANVDHSLTLLASACGSSTCVTTGRYEDSSNLQHGLIVSSTDGVVASAVQAPVPAGATADPNLSDVSCWSASSCVAVGVYSDSNNHSAAVVVPIQDGVAQPAETLAMPAGTTYSELMGVKCTDAGSCVAVGDYGDSSGAAYGLVVPISGNGVPGAPLQVLEPASSTAGVQSSGLYDVSCQGSSACVAVGYYQSDVAGDYGAEVVPINGGTPGTAQAVALPANATTTAGDQNVDIEKVACPATGTCAAVGTYVDSSVNSYDIVVPITGGVAGTAVQATLPSDANGTQVFFPSVSCQATDWCVEAGQYSTVHGDRPVVIPIDNGVPTGDVESSLPPGVPDPATTWQNARLDGVSCPSSGGDCLAVGDYDDANGNVAAMTVTFNAGVIGSGAATPSPADESTVAPGYYLATVGCSPSSCAATGAYTNTAGVDGLMELSAQSELAIGTASLAAGTVGTAYSQTLSASGAWGLYSWSVSGGNLPAGLSLNAQTGVISGTPTTAGTGTFTVEATGTGLPLQTATHSYSVSIAAAPTTTTTTTSTTTTPPAPPECVLRLLTSSTTVAKNKFRLKLVCSAAPCHGSLKLQIRETVTVKRGNKKVRKHRTVAIGNAGFSLAVGQDKTVLVTLDAAGRRALAAGHRLSVTVLDTMAGVKQTLGHVTLRPAPVKHKKK